MENWNFKIDGREKILEIQSKIDGLIMKLKMIDTSRGHYGIVIETGMKPEFGLLYVVKCSGRYSISIADTCTIYVFTINYKLSVPRK